MNWTHVFFSGVAGAVIAIAIGVFRKKGWLGKFSAVVIVVALIIAWNLFDAHYLSSHPQVNTEQAVDTTFLKIPGFQVLKEQEPQLWQHLRHKAAQMMQEGKTEQQVIDAIQPQVLQVQMARLQQAPDSNVLEYIKINLEQTAAVQKKGDEECFKFLFPAVKGGVNSSRLIPQDMLIRRLDSNVRLMRAGFGPNKHIMTEAEKQQATRDLQNVVSVLAGRYGEDIEIMTNPSLGVGKEKIACNLIQDLWTEVLKLPAANAAGVVRFSVSAAVQ